MLIKAKKRLCAFKFSDKEVKEDIKKNLQRFTWNCKDFDEKNGSRWYYKESESFNSFFFPFMYSRWVEGDKTGSAKTEYFDVPTKITKTKVFTRIQILNIAVVEYMEFDKKVLFTIYYK